VCRCVTYVFNAVDAEKVAQPLDRVGLEAGHETGKVSCATGRGSVGCGDASVDETGYYACEVKGVGSTRATSDN
jgi:hypothetical protein